MSEFENEERKARARTAANELIALIEEHEREDHDGGRCLPNRASLVAFVAHSLGLTQYHLDVIAECMIEYEHQHPRHQNGDHP